MLEICSKRLIVNIEAFSFSICSFMKQTWRPAVVWICFFLPLDFSLLSSVTIYTESIVEKIRRKTNSCLTWEETYFLHYIYSDIGSPSAWETDKYIMRLFLSFFSMHVLFVHLSQSVSIKIFVSCYLCSSKHLTYSRR